MKRLVFYSMIVCVFASCSNGNKNGDAAGAFESVETIVSTEASGTLMQFNVEEGQVLQPGQQVGYVDSTQLYYRKEQLADQEAATITQLPDIRVQLSSLQSELNAAVVYQKRLQNLFEQNVGTRQALDDANTKVTVLKDQISALKSSLKITSTTLYKTIKPLRDQEGQITDQLAKCRIVNPIHGTVLTKFAENHEVVGPGKALYKIAETDTLILRAYITGSQLDDIKLGQQVNVRTDDGAKKYRSYKGLIFWISDKAEFTPKTIQT
ncbi:MAG: HlyD family secretion protein, partial [Bacteroidia bacterium]